MTDVFAIHGDIAEQVAEALKVQLLSNEKRSIEKKATESPEAFTLYLKGRYYWNERTTAGVNKAIKYFEEAVKIDPNFAMAFSGLADAYLIMADYGWIDPSEAGSLAKVYAAKTVEIDDILAEAHASLGLTLLNHSWDFPSAERELKRAVELRPNYPAAYHWYAIMLAFLNKYEEAFVMSDRAISLDPYSRVVNMSRGANLYYLRKYDQALEQLSRVIDSNPDFAAAHFWKSFVYAQIHKFEDSIKEGVKAVELDNGSPPMKLNLAWIYARAGDKESATKLINEVMSEKKGYVSPGSLALVKLALEEKDEGFALLEKARQTRDMTLLYLRGSPSFAEYPV